MEVEAVKIEGEELKEILQRAKESEPENKYLLFLSTYHYSGCMGLERTDFKVIHGDADVVELSKTYDGSRADAESAEYVIIPKTIPVIVRVIEFSDIERHQYDHEYLYVFTKEGWRRVGKCRD